jgi:hypothetical protein
MIYSKDHSGSGDGKENEGERDTEQGLLMMRGIGV